MNSIDYLYTDMSDPHFSNPTYRQTKRTDDYNTFYELLDSLPNPGLDKFQKMYKKLGLEYPSTQIFKGYFIPL
jgi:hypothetical protein